MKVMRFGLQALIVLVALAVMVFAVSDSVSLTQLSPSQVSGSFDYKSKIDPAVLDDSAYLNGEDVRVIVSVLDRKGDVPKTERILNKIVKLVGEEKVSERFGTDSFVAELNRNEIEKVARNIYVERVSSTKPIFKANLNEVIPIVDADNTWNTYFYDSSLDGSGQTIAIVDHGIDFTHADLDEKNIVGANVNCNEVGGCFIDPSQTDTNGHGTHVAGIAAAAPAQNGEIPGGVAKGADLIALKVFRDGEEWTSDIEMTRAVNWVVANKDIYNIGVISMSIGSIGFTYSDFCDNALPALRNAVNTAVNNGLAFVVSTGNDGDSNGIEAPACFSKAIPVSATDDNDNIWGFSNYWPLGNAFAPGAGVTSTCAAAQGNGAYCTYSGTSMSTPAVSGALAIAYQAMEMNGQPRSLHPKDELYPMLIETGADISGLNPNLFSRIDVDDFIIELLSDIGQGCLQADTENHYRYVC